MIDHDKNLLARPARHDFLDRSPCDISNEPSICTASNSSRERNNVEQLPASPFSWRIAAQLGGRDHDPGVLVVAAPEMFEHLIDLEVIIAVANLGEGFVRSKGATAATADVIFTEQRPLRAGPERSSISRSSTNRGKMVARRAHHAKYFWISFTTSMKRSTSALVL